MEDLEGENNQFDNEVTEMAMGNTCGINVLEVLLSMQLLIQSLFSIAFDMREIASFTRLLQILLRVMSFLEQESTELKRFRIIVLQKFLMSSSTDEGISSECMSLRELLIVGWHSFFWYLTHVPIHHLSLAVSRIGIETGFLQRILTLIIY